MCSDEFMTALDSSLAKCSAEGIKFSQLPLRQREIARYMSETLDEEWRTRRGMEIISVALSKVTPDDDSRRRIEEFDTNVMHSNPEAMAGGLAYARMAAMKDAAKNSAGAMTGFMGVGMAASALGGSESQGVLLENAQKMQAAKEAGKKAASGRVCPKCGAGVTGKFCPECGEKMPDEEAGWVCSCGARNTGRFCSECGKAKPESGYTCSCGYRSDKPFKFCPECGKQSD